VIAHDCTSGPVPIYTANLPTWCINSNVRNVMLFTLENQGQSLLRHTNKHQSTSIVVNSYLPLPIHTQSHQFPFQECRSVCILYKLPDATLDCVNCQFKTASKLVRCRTLLPILTYFFYHFTFPGYLIYEIYIYIYKCHLLWAFIY